MQENNMDNIISLKKDINVLRNKVTECKKSNITDSFDIEMKIMTELPELYDSYPWLIKR